MSDQVIAEGKMDREVTVEKIMLLTDKGYFYLEPFQPVKVPANSTVSVRFSGSVTATPPKKKTKSRSEKTAEKSKPADMKR